MNITRHEKVTVNTAGVSATTNTRRTKAEFINNSGSDVFLYRTDLNNAASALLGNAIILRAYSSYTDTSKNTLSAVVAAGTADITVIEYEQ